MRARSRRISLGDDPSHLGGLGLQTLTCTLPPHEFPLSARPFATGQHDAHAGLRSDHIKQLGNGHARRSAPRIRLPSTERLLLDVPPDPSHARRFTRATSCCLRDGSTTVVDRVTNYTGRQCG